MSKITSPLQRLAYQNGHQPALVNHREAISFLNYVQRVLSVIDKLKNNGIQKSDRVAIVSDNSIEYIILLVALWHYGAVACPINPRFPEKAIVAMLESINCAYVITDVSFSISSDKYQLLPLDSLVVENENALSPINMPKLDLDNDATIIFSSGSSAAPKAVLHTLANHYYSALGSNENITIKPEDRWLLSLPLYHVGGLGIIMRTLLSGAIVVVPQQKESINSSIDKYRISHLSLVATQLQRWLKEGTDFSKIDHLKAILLGGGPLPEKLIEKAYNLHLPIYASYGSTEMTSQIATTTGGDSLEKLLTSGRALNYREVKISSEGEILVRGKTLFKGYVSDSGLKKPFNTEGWFATGDLGKVDSDGYLTVMGRKDNMFISGGENIQPEEIEKVLMMSEQVENALVVSIDDPEFGQRPVAFIKLKDDVSLDVSVLSDFLKSYLPKFKIPVRYYSWPAHIETENFKLKRQSFKSLAKKLDLV